MEVCAQAVRGDKTLHNKVSFSKPIDFIFPQVQLWHNSVQMVHSQCHHRDQVFSLHAVMEDFTMMWPLLII